MTFVIRLVFDPRVGPKRFITCALTYNHHFSDPTRVCQMSRVVSNKFFVALLVCLIDTSLPISKIGV